MEKQLIKTINARHITAVDKLYRMHGGLASELVDYRNQTIQLKINVTEKWIKSPLETAQQLAHSWKASNLELAEAVYFNVNINGIDQNIQIRGRIGKETS